MIYSSNDTQAKYTEQGSATNRPPLLLIEIENPAINFHEFAINRAINIPRINGNRQ